MSNGRTRLGRPVRAFLPISVVLYELLRGWIQTSSDSRIKPRLKMKRGYVAFYAPVVWGRGSREGEYADVKSSVSRLIQE